MDNLVEDIGMNIKYEHIKSFYKKTGNLTDTVILVLGTIGGSDKFTTSRWIESVLNECKINKERFRIVACITSLKGKLRCIKGIEYSEGPQLVDLEVPKRQGRGSGGRPTIMIRLNSRGKERLLGIIESNKECFEN